MRWDGGGDDGADEGDGVDDDPDDARRDGDDDGSVSPLREGNSPADFSLPELFFSLSGFRLMEAVENSSSMPPRFLGQGSLIRRSGAGEGPQGPGRAPPAALGGPAAGVTLAPCCSPLRPLLAS